MHLINSTVSFISAIKDLSSDHKDAIKSMGSGGAASYARDVSQKTND